MKQMNHRFEHWYRLTHWTAPELVWYRLTHWTAPELVRRDDGRYEDEAVQAMYIAYRAGYNRATKDRKLEVKEANQ